MSRKQFVNRNAFSLRIDNKGQLNQTFNCVKANYLQQKSSFVWLIDVSPIFINDAWNSALILYFYQHQLPIMAATPQQSDAIKLIGDCAKWLATVETGAIAVIGAIYKNGLPDDCYYPFFITIFSFVFSIVLTSGILVSLPAAFQDIHPEEKVWDRKATLGVFFPPLIHLISGQFLFFLIGLVSFGAGVMILISN